MNIDLYRAILQSSFDANKAYKRYSTQRAPGNIPYVVDNILEWLRPEDMPNRRFCAYANLTPEQALKNATPSKSDDVVKAYKLVISGGNVKIANLATDARYHPDIKVLKKLVEHEANGIIQSQDKQAKAQIAPFFLPCLTKEEMNELAATSKEVASILNKAQEMSSFWKDARFIPGESEAKDGELFFELAGPDDSYTLSEF